MSNVSSRARLETLGLSEQVCGEVFECSREGGSRFLYYTMASSCCREGSGRHRDDDNGLLYLSRFVLVTC